MVVQRSIPQIIKELAGQNPVITITGPRQSGKTTFVKHLFQDKAYVHLVSDIWNAGRIIEEIHATQ